MEATTREGYTYSIRKHIIPWFGPMRMNQIMPSDVREWVTHLSATGVKPPSIRNLKSILSAIFTTALNDQVTFLHPCKGVKTPTVARSC
jgi:site-specific recombinase XerC